MATIGARSLVFAAFAAGKPADARNFDLRFPVEGRMRPARSGADHNGKNGTMANTTNTTNTSSGGNGGLYFIVGAITIAVVLIIAILSGAINITGQSGGGTETKKLDITIETPKAPAPTAPAPAPTK